MPELLFLDRGRFRELPGAEAVQTGPNVYEATIPVTPAVRRIVRAEVTAAAFDDALWMVDGVESMQSLGSGETAELVRVTILLP